MTLSTSLQTPRIVFCGDQSAGKSSVIQRICGVNLPRSSGTCTRCPIEVRLRSEAPKKGAWSCEVAIR
jgi:GTP-binding protein EngB required for normal cell division